MSNPFMVPGSVFLDSQRRKRQQFKVSVYAVLCSLTILFIGMLIQGCRQELPQNNAAAAGESSSTNTMPEPLLIPAPEAPSFTPAPVEQAAIAEPVLSNTPAPEILPIASNETAYSAQQIPVVLPTEQPVQPKQAEVTRPSANKPAVAKSATKSYQVQKGDTLTRIAKAHGTTVTALKSVNGLKTDRITVGSTLKIPSRSSRSSQPLQS